MELTKRVLDNTLVVDITGDLDTQTAGPAMDALQEHVDAKPGNFLINLAGLDFVSSSGLRVILRTAKQVRANGGNMKVCGASGMVKEVLEISGFHRLLDMYDEEAQALAAF
ncbi:MAG: anti-sigma factor antagonist [Gammaproteobacteria bacterium]|jgi:anti-sigma B factor antagonist|nr:anti-sigma factor antagonist [Gammaproteobacteria bacterium]